MPANVGMRIINEQVFLAVANAIDKSMVTTSKELATLGIVKMQSYVPIGRARKNREFGPLKKSIMNKPRKGSTKKGYGRYDIIIDCPYAMWVEYGKYAPFGLPSSPIILNKEGAPLDFRQTNYEGANSGQGFIRKAIAEIAEPSIFLPIFKFNMISQIKSIKSISI